jgi:hypothetical protein
VRPTRRGSPRRPGPSARTSGWTACLLCHEVLPSLRDLDTGLAAAVEAGDIDPVTSVIDQDVEPVSAGDLARDTLAYLAQTQPETVHVIGRAITMTGPGAGMGSRFDPATLAVGALVVLALQTDVHLERANTGKWKLTIHKKAMSDATLARLLARLLTMARPH